MLDKNLIYHGDCLEVMKDIDDKSVDMILCDLPYGTTVCKWDTVIPFEPLWKQYKRVIKDNGAIVLFGSEPFSSRLRCSNLGWYRYDWIWVKENSTGFINAHCQPLKIFESISVFSKSKAVPSAIDKMQYYPQGLTDYNKITKRGSGGDTYNQQTIKKENFQRYTNYPTNILYFQRDKNKLHPTQKPVALFEYLIKTYTNEGELVLDNCIGSGTTAIACLNTNRNFIGIEKELKYVQIANQRIQSWLRKE